MKTIHDNEWSEVQGDVATIGITTAAAKEIGEIVFVELPKVGSKVTAGQEVVVLESTKAAVDIYCPLSGEIVAVNESLRTNVQELNEAPEGDGWLFRLKIRHPASCSYLIIFGLVFFPENILMMLVSSAL